MEISSGAKAHRIFARHSARLKPCPFKCEGYFKGSLLLSNPRAASGAMSTSCGAASPVAAKASQNMVLQKGQAAAMVCAPVATSSAARLWLTRSLVSSPRKARPPPTPQQKLRSRLRCRLELNTSRSPRPRPGLPVLHNAMPSASLSHRPCRASLSQEVRSWRVPVWGASTDPR
jgi:hypothetical protein